MRQPDLRRELDIAEADYTQDVMALGGKRGQNDAGRA
jgi:hypothetical protein